MLAFFLLALLLVACSPELSSTMAMTVSPELAESLVLGVAALWFFHLYFVRRAGMVPIFASVYLAIPSIGLGLQSFGFDIVAGPFKWVAVICNLLITVILIEETSKPDSTIVRAFVEQEDSRLLAEARGRTAALAKILEAQLAEQC